MTFGGCLGVLILYAAFFGLIAMPIAALMMVVSWGAVGWYYAIVLFGGLMIRAAAS